jgi:hypothetical protein
MRFFIAIALAVFLWVFFLGPRLTTLPQWNSGRFPQSAIIIIGIGIPAVIIAMLIGKK